jgi:ribosomal protein S27E
MEKNLKSLDEYNGERVQCHFNLTFDQPRFNGITCPKCGEELMDTNPMVTLTSYPPKKNVNCSKCEYIGYRIA